MSRPGQIERMSQLLARRLEETGHSGDDAVSVADLHRRLLPYHLCRDELGLTTKAEYDQLMLELIGESGCVRASEPLLSSAIRKERASPEPGLAFLQRFAASRLLLLERLPDELSDALPEPPAAPAQATGPSDPAPAVRESERPGNERRPAPRRPTPDRSRAAARRRPAPGSERRPKPDLATRPCRSCHRTLPERDGLRYCPHCGVDQTFRPCRGCDAELDLSWTFCPMCGESASSTG